jgi:molecular chaperone DnaK (HSP70)
MTMIAIDFGTTNSSLAVFSDGDAEPRLQKLEFGDPDSYDPNVMPSGVCSCSNAECVGRPDTFGHEAFRHHFGPQHDSRLLHEMKLFFDQSTANPPSFAKEKEVTILRETDGFLTRVSKSYRIPIYKGDVPLQPNQFVPGTASLIRELIRRSTVTPLDRTEIAVGVPASFHGAGMRRLREASRLGAFGDKGSCERISLYLEPYAAARSYLKFEKGNILVLDYGGGTLDITVMKVDRPNVFDPANIVYGGFPEAGSRMDEAILHYRLDKAGEEAQRWYEAAPLRTRLQFKRNVEKAKIALSIVAETTIELPESGIAPIRLTRDQVSLALQPIINRMGIAVSEVVMGAIGGVKNLDFVVLSGGTSLVGPVQDGVRAMFQHIPVERFVLPDPTKPEDVEVCFCAVARGLALLHRDGFEPIQVPAKEDDAAA